MSDNDSVVYVDFTPNEPPEKTLARLGVYGEDYELKVFPTRGKPPGCDAYFQWITPGAFEKVKAAADAHNLTVSRYLGRLFFPNARSVNGHPQKN